MPRMRPGRAARQAIPTPINRAVKFPTFSQVSSDRQYWRTGSPSMAHGAGNKDTPFTQARGCTPAFAFITTRRRLYHLLAWG